MIYVDDGLLMVDSVDQLNKINKKLSRESELTINSGNSIKFDGNAIECKEQEIEVDQHENIKACER